MAAYLGWIPAALLVGMLLLRWLGKKRSKLQVRFNAINSLCDKSYTEIITIVKASSQLLEHRANGDMLRTWSEGDYSISLLFDSDDRCLGVEEECM
ncbi:MAG: hypothetical protein GX096_07660 [Clostridiales bacterium]|nr:hypothetical protein [Clostridiales bacterium]